MRNHSRFLLFLFIILSIWTVKPALTVQAAQEASQPTPTLELRVNYGHDWVESFYEPGHTVNLTVTESDGVTVKATTEVVTESKEFWGGTTGFTTQPEDWQPAPPDLQPYDWVYASVDNGASSQVQLGEVQGTIDLAADSVEGVMTAPWISGDVDVECHPWGAPEPVELRFDAIQPDGVDLYSCSWAGEWDIQSGQDVGVAYYGPDGHWVANAFFAPDPASRHIIASTAGDWFWTSGFNPGMLDLFIYDSADDGATLLWQGSQEANEAGFVHILYEDHGQDLVPGYYLVVSDGTIEKGLVLETITMAVFDTDNEIMVGTAPHGREVTVVAGMAEAETQGVIRVIADPDNGAWRADFHSISFDITEEMRPSSFAQIHDEDGDANEAGTSPLPPPAPTPAPLPTSPAPTAELLYPTLTGAFIELTVEPMRPDLWTRIQWQDAFGDWHDVDGWQGTFLEDGRVLWYVGADHLGTGPFRWLVYASQGGDWLGVSQPFALPSRSGEVLHVVVLLLAQDQVVTAAPSLAENVALGKPVIVTTNAAADDRENPGVEPADITDGRLDYLPAGDAQDDGTVGYVNDNYNQRMVITITIDLLGTYDVSTIRYNMGDVRRAETWNADWMTTPFGTTSTNPGAPGRGAWTTYTGRATLSTVIIVLEKTRTSYETDWLFIGEIEVYGTPAGQS
ncbi:MAG: hypothetical protein AB1791_21755 [Chloroflexota bacterium]